MPSEIRIHVLLAASGSFLGSHHVQSTLLGRDLVRLIMQSDVASSIPKLFHKQSAIDLNVPLAEQGITDGTQLTLVSTNGYERERVLTGTKR